jgi:hypothetical protein
MGDWQGSLDLDFFLTTEMIFAGKKAWGDATGFYVMELSMGEAYEEVTFFHDHSCVI